MILIPSSVEVEFAGGGFGLLRTGESPAELGRLRPIGQILPDVLARYGIAAELPAELSGRGAAVRS
jgi:hypothetical protein